MEHTKPTSSNGSSSLDSEKQVFENKKEIAAPDAKGPQGREVNQQQLGPEWEPRKQEKLIIGVLMLVSLIAALDTTVLTPALPVGYSRKIVISTNRFRPLHSPSTAA